LDGKYQIIFLSKGGEGVRALIIITGKALLIFAKERLEIFLDIL